MDDLCRICLKKCLLKKAIESKVIRALSDIFRIKVRFALFCLHMETF